MLLACLGAQTSSGAVSLINKLTTTYWVCLSFLGELSAFGGFTWKPTGTANFRGSIFLKNTPITTTQQTAAFQLGFAVVLSIDQPTDALEEI